MFVVIASAALFNLGGWSGTWFRLEAAEAAGVTPPYDLSVTKVADPSPEVIAGAVLTYTVKVSNAVTSTIPTDYIKLTDVLDPGAAGGLLRSLTAPPGWVCGLAVTRVSTFLTGNVCGMKLEQEGQGFPFNLDRMVACHSCPFLQSHQTFSP